MNPIQSVKELKVGLNFGDDTIPVGRLAIRDNQIYFEYNNDFVDRGIEISPYKLPLQRGLQSFDLGLFEGLSGVFNDSLPDGWGRLLFDRYARTQGVAVDTITPLDRLAYIGGDGLGALVYKPDYSIDNQSDNINLDTLWQQSQDVLNGESDTVLSELIALNGSSAGARPKALIGINETKTKIIHGVNQLPDGYTPWIVKFPNSQDNRDSGAIEYVYALMAKDAGIIMPDVHLFPSENGAGYFAIKRFDRNGNNRYHMHTACGLLHSDFRVPSLDYQDLMNLTYGITRDVRDVERMYQLAVFNVLSHNRDDHSKNFSFLMDKTGGWNLSPAYDLTFSSGIGEEQSTMVMGEGKSITTTHLEKLAEQMNIDSKPIIEKTKESLSNWQKLATKHGINKTQIKSIKNHICL